jgi:archaetidylinositol phosphate synthase
MDSNMLSRFRGKYEETTLFVGKTCANLTATPNVLTILATCCGVVAAILLWNCYFMLAILFILLSAFGDMADGATARYLKKESSFGTVFDRVNDRYVEFFLAMGCIGSGRVHAFWACFTLFGAVMASYTRACAESVGRVRNCSVGLMERQEKAILFLLGLLLEPVLNQSGRVASSINPFTFSMQDGILILQYSMILQGILSHYTVYQRLVHAKHHANET